MTFKTNVQMLGPWSALNTRAKKGWDGMLMNKIRNTWEGVPEPTKQFALKRVS